MMPGQSTLIRTYEHETGERTNHIVPRDRARKMIEAFRREGFVVVYVQHNYKEGAH